MDQLWPIHTYDANETQQSASFADCWVESRRRRRCELDITAI